MKKPTWLGARSGRKSMTNVPAVVLTTACLFDISSIVNGVLNGTAGFAGGFGAAV
jgi:hypothetical protein